MKGATDSKAWRRIVAGVLGLAAVGIAVRHASNPSPEAGGDSPLAAAAPHLDTERGGWIAQPQPGTGARGTEQHRAGAARGRVADRSDTIGRDSGARDFRDTDTVDLGGDAISAQRGAPPATPAAAGNVVVSATGAAALPGAEPVAHTEGAGAEPAAKPGAAKSAAPDTQAVAEAKDSAKMGTQDENGPVFSLPLEKSADPDKGDTAPIITNGITFDANGAHFSADSQLLIPNGGNVNPSAGTITFWTVPDWAGETEGDAMYVQLGADTFENHIRFFKNNRYMRFLFADDSGYEAGGGQDVSNWKPGDSHMVTGTWGDGITVLYLDGVAADAHDYSGDLQLGPDPPLILGSTHPGVKSGASSNLKGFQIYARALGADEVAALFAQPPR